MKDLFSKLGEIAQQAAGAAQQGKKGDIPGLGGMASGGSDLLGKVGGAMSGSMGGVGGLLGAGALGGILGSLLSGKKAGKVGKGLLVAGGTAAAATMAWSFYRKWSESQTRIQPEPVSQLPSQQSPQTAGQALSAGAGGDAALVASADPVAMLILEAMVFAVRSDGHMDEQEQQAVHQAMAQLFPGTDVAAHIDTLMTKRLDPEDIARRVNNHDEACELYRLSRVMVSGDNSMERAYLDALARALKLTASEQQQFEEEVQAMHAQQASPS